MTHFTFLAAAAVLGTITLAQAQTATYNVKVPFAFSAGSETLPAGQYRLSIDETRHVTLADPDGGLRYLPLAIPAHSSGKAPVLVFNLYGDSYFLHAVKNVRGGGLTWLPSEREKEFAKSAAARSVPVPVGGAE